MSLGVDGNGAGDAEQTEVSWRAIAVRNGVQVQTSASIFGTAFDGQSAGFTSPIELALLSLGEATAIELVKATSRVSPPRPLGPGGSGNRERRPSVSQRRLSRLPDPYPTLDYFVNPQQPAAG